jgi:D-beta-D-heptose 7-phosphate kinase/D-beta-D-heptose 1-phosphate adenosyltransferase
MNGESARGANGLGKDRAGEILAKFPKTPVLVLGDLMLDRFVWGEVSRISPEAPVPVVRVKRETSTLGGAGNVVSNLAALGGAARVAGILGGDETGRQTGEMLRACGADMSAVLTDPARPGTLKMRVIAHSQQVVRVDQESDALLPADLRAQFLAAALAALAGVRALVISDYDKGVVCPEVLSAVLGAARAAGVPVLVDPKISHFPHYQPVTLLTPNQSEAARATAIEIRDEADVERAGRKILDQLDTRGVLITRGDRGMALFERDRPTWTIPARAREVFDVTGAGDTVVAVLTLALAAGAGLREAAELANVAGGLVVSRLGTATVTAKEVLEGIG